jgi:hypothetical protein
LYCRQAIHQSSAGSIKMRIAMAQLQQLAAMLDLGCGALCAKRL